MQTTLPQTQTLHPLSFVDFAPLRLSEPGRGSAPIYETFGQVLAKANQWLQQHPTASVKSCETIEVHMRHNDTRPVYTDKSFLDEGLDRRLYFIKCLRLWFRPKESTDAPEAQQIGHASFLPKRCAQWETLEDSALYETWEEMLERINRQLDDQPLPGTVLGAETMTMRSRGEAVQADNTCHMVQGDRTSYSFKLLRVFYQLGPPAYEHIGFTDFTPRCLKPGSLVAVPQYQAFSDLLQRLPEWLAHQQPNFNLLNIQTVPVEMVKSSKEPIEWTLDAQRTFFYGNTDYKTRFVYMLRVYHTVSESGVQSRVPEVLTHHTFQPAQLSHAATLRGLVFETVSDTMNRAQGWLQQQPAGVHVVCAETVPLVCQSDKAVTDSELCCVSARREQAKDVVFALRVYFDGDLQEPDMADLPPLPAIQPAQHQWKLHCVIL